MTLLSAIIGKDWIFDSWYYDIIDHGEHGLDAIYEHKGNIFKMNLKKKKKSKKKNQINSLWFWHFENKKSDE